MGFEACLPSSRAGLTPLPMKTAAKCIYTDKLSF
jgi:hypothetical protein